MTAKDGFQAPERYEIQETLVENEGEILYRGRDRVLLREVILKRPGPGLASTLMETGDTPRALREARALAQVQHPGVVRLIDVVECPGGPLLVMEPIPGETLAERLEREGRLEPEEIARIATGLAGALEAVHGIGAVHRGLSVANIMIQPDGQPCLAGFLFAKFAKSSLGISSISYAPRQDESGQLDRSIPGPKAKVLPSHPAPEQLYSQAADARSDVFGLGSVLYRCLTGSEAFPDMLTSGWTPPKKPEELGLLLPRSLTEIIFKCLARSPLGRYQSAAELKHAIETCSLTDSPISLRPGRRTVLAGVVVLAIAATLIGSLINGPQDKKNGQSGSASIAGANGASNGSASASTGNAPPYSEHYENSYALLIGISNYEDETWHDLNNAVADVEAIANRLEQMPWENWQITRLLNEDATREGILAALNALKNDKGINDRLFIYYAGHGEAHEESNESGFLIPTDAQHTDTDKNRTRWIRFDEINNHVFRETRAKHVLVAMDCCYSGRISSYRSSAISAVKQSHPDLMNPAYVVIASGRPNERVEDGIPGKNSPFARAFLLALDQALESDQSVLKSTSLYTRIDEYFTANLVGHSPMKHEYTPYQFLFFLKRP